MWRLGEFVILDLTIGIGFGKDEAQKKEELQIVSVEVEGEFRSGHSSMLLIRHSLVALKTFFRGRVVTALVFGFVSHFLWRCS